MTVRIVTAYSGLGGSTIAHINLVNLFNANGIDAILYGPQDWHLNKCKSGKIQEAMVAPDDQLILHCTNLPERLPCKKIVLSCHETNVFPVKEIKNPVWENIHFVSKFQKDWHGVDGVVIPNVISDLNKKRFVKPKYAMVAGVIGSIFEHKQTHLSIKRALDSGYKKVKIYGVTEDPNYFLREVYPLLNQDVSYCGVVDDKQKIYDTVDIVFHSSKRETFNFVRAECWKAGIPYDGLDSANPEVEYWENNKILESWKQLLNI